MKLSLFDEFLRVLCVFAVKTTFHGLHEKNSLVNSDFRTAPTDDRPA
jgi:hypothetical protein